MFGKKKLEGLEGRIEALHIRVAELEKGEGLKDLQDRVKKIEKEVMPETSSMYFLNEITRQLYGGPAPRVLSLRDRIDRLCKYLKIEFHREEEKIVVRPVKSKRGDR